jgi:hypothetical protein
MPVVILKCPICEKDFERNKKEYTRSQKLGRPSYCSRSCCGKAHAKNLGEYYGNGNIDNIPIEKRGTNLRDKYTPFRYFLRAIKRRQHKKGATNIDLEFLENLWNKQKGKCPFTGWNLNLPEGSCARKDRSIYRASLDRIDNSKGYVKGNVRFVAIMANYCRHIFSDNEVRLFCEAVTSTKKVDT